MKADSTDPWKFIRTWYKELAKDRKVKLKSAYLKTYDEFMMAWTGRSKKNWQTYLEGFNPHESFVGRKPENTGVEFKSLHCSISGILLWCEFEEGKIAMKKKKYRNKVKHTVAVQLRGVEDSGHLGSDDHFAGDSWFAGVDTALAYLKAGCHFTGIVKTGHALFPKDTLATYTPANLGGFIVYEAVIDGKRPGLWAVGVRTGRKKINQIITTCGTTHMAGRRTYASWDKDGHRRTITRERTEIDAEYSKAQPAADVFNKLRQGHAGLAIEKSYRPRNFEGRCFQTAMGTLAVDAFLFARITPLSCKYKAHDLKKFIKALSYQLLTNPWRTDEFKRARCRSLSSYRNTPAVMDKENAASNFDRRPAHSKQVSFGSLRDKDGNRFKTTQKWCLICNTKTSFFCPDCGTSAPICRSTLRPECGASHLHCPTADHRPSIPRSTGARRSRSKTPSPPLARRVLQRTAATADVATARRVHDHSRRRRRDSAVTPSTPATSRVATDDDGNSTTDDEAFVVAAPTFTAPTAPTAPTSPAFDLDALL